MLRLNVGRGSFSSLGAVPGAEACTAVVWRVMSWMSWSHVGVLSGVTKAQPWTEQARGAGGAMVLEKKSVNWKQVDCLFTYSTEDINRIGK